MLISNLPNKELKVMLIKMFIKCGKIMDEHSENFGKEMENKRKYQIEITEPKNTVSEKHSSEVQEHIA